MKIATKKITIEEEIFTLTNLRAAFWESEKALILSDLHIGKAAHFRKNGIGLSNQILHQDLKRLSFLIDYFKVEQLIIVGDLIHAGNNSEVEEFCEWKNQYPDIVFSLVEGNHDRLSKKLESQLNLDFKETILEKSRLKFVHDFDKNEKGFQITGHIHPGYVINSPIKKIKLPCFVQTKNQLLLPAFSEFTGLDTKNIPKNGNYFIFTEEEIYEI